MHAFQMKQTAVNQPTDTSSDRAWSSSMKLFKAALIMLALLLCWAVNGYADRLYTWTDAQGMTHITQDPPPDTAQVVDTIDYLPQPNQPVYRSTASDRTNQQQENLDQGAGQSRSGSDSGYASGDVGNDVQYGGDSYRQTLRRYMIEHKLLDNNEPGEVDDLLERMQPRPRR
jgi:hypothetical protein